MAHQTHARAGQPTRSSWPFMRKVQWIVTILLVAIAEVVFLNGQTMLSYVIDAVAVAAFFWIRKLRSPLD